MLKYWFRNVWPWGSDAPRPVLRQVPSFIQAM
jgi:hypothetical protein